MRTLCIVTMTGVVRSIAEIVVGLLVVEVKLVVVFSDAKMMSLLPLCDCRR